MTYYQVLISAEERVRGMAILRALIAKRLAFGGPAFSGGALFLWENDIVENDHCYAITCTRDDLKDELTREAERVSAEIACMMSFIPFEGNKAPVELLDSAFEDCETRPPPTPIDAVAHNEYLPMSKVATHTRSSFA